MNCFLDVQQIKQSPASLYISESVQLIVRCRVFYVS